MDETRFYSHNLEATKSEAIIMIVSGILLLGIVAGVSYGKWEAQQAAQAEKNRVYIQEITQRCPAAPPHYVSGGLMIITHVIPENQKRICLAT